MLCVALHITATQYRPPLNLVVAVQVLQDQFHVLFAVHLRAVRLECALPVRERLVGEDLGLAVTRPFKANAVRGLDEWAARRSVPELLLGKRHHLLLLHHLLRLLFWLLLDFMRGRHIEWRGMDILAQPLHPVVHADTPRILHIHLHLRIHPASPLLPTSLQYRQ